MKQEFLHGVVVAAKSVPAGISAVIIAGLTLPEWAATVGIFYTLVLLGCLAWDRTARWRRRE